MTGRALDVIIVLTTVVSVLIMHADSPGMTVGQARTDATGKVSVLSCTAVDPIALLASSSLTVPVALQGSCRLCAAFVFGKPVSDPVWLGHALDAPEIVAAVLGDVTTERV